MKRIYTHAYSVVVWLGPFNEHADTAMKELAQTALVSLIELESAEDHWTSRTSTGVWVKHQFESWFKDLHLPTLVDVLSRNYWKRMWIIQELALNHHLTAFLCGDLQLSRVMMWSLARFCTIYCAKIHRILESNDTSRTVAALWQLGYDIFNLLGFPEHPKLPELEQLLDLARKSKVKQGQDKVYGMLGLLPPSLVETIDTNYSLHQTEVYKEFASSVLSYYKDSKLDAVLSWCSFSPDNKGPSWVPNWEGDFSRNHPAAQMVPGSKGSCRRDIHLSGSSCDDLYWNYRRLYQKHDSLAARVSPVSHTASSGDHREKPSNRLREVCRHVTCCKACIT